MTSRLSTPGDRRVWEGGSPPASQSLPWLNLSLHTGAALGPLLAGLISPTGWNNVFYMLISADVLACLVSAWGVQTGLGRKGQHRSWGPRDRRALPMGLCVCAPICALSSYDLPTVPLSPGVQGNRCLADVSEQRQKVRSPQRLPISLPMGSSPALSPPRAQTGPTNLCALSRVSIALIWPSLTRDSLSLQSQHFCEYFLQVRNQ